METLDVILGTVATIAFLYGSALYYRLRRLARAAGYPVSIFLKEDAWPSIDSMISRETAADKRAELIRLKRRAQICMIVTVLSFVGMIATSVSQ